MRETGETLYANEWNEINYDPPDDLCNRQN